MTRRTTSSPATDPAASLGPVPLICAVVGVGVALIVGVLLHHWQPERQP